MATFGDRLRELRKAARLTQRELAARAKIDFTFLSKLENDKEVASERTIRALAEALRADSDELLLLAQKIPSEQREAITGSEAGRTFFRTARGLSDKDWEELADMAKRLRKKK